jgi:hypothetical protein
MDFRGARIEWLRGLARKTDGIPTFSREKVSATTCQTEPEQYFSDEPGIIPLGGIRGCWDG